MRGHVVISPAKINISPTLCVPLNERRVIEMGEFLCLPDRARDPDATHDDLVRMLDRLAALLAHGFADEGAPLWANEAARLLAVANMLEAQSIAKRRLENHAHKF